MLKTKYIGVQGEKTWKTNDDENDEKGHFDSRITMNIENVQKVDTRALCVYQPTSLPMTAKMQLTFWKETIWRRRSSGWCKTPSPKQQEHLNDHHLWYKDSMLSRILRRKKMFWFSFLNIYHSTKGRIPVIWIGRDWIRFGFEKVTQIYENKGPIFNNFQLCLGFFLIVQNRKNWLATHVRIKNQRSDPVK